MANIDQLLLAMKRKLEESGVTGIQDPENLANELVEIIKKRRMEAVPSGSHAGSSGLETDKNIEFEDNLPVFSSSGDIVHPNQIDNSFSTLDNILGKRMKSKSVLILSTIFVKLICLYIM